MEIQQQISADLNQQKIGKTYKVLIDKKEGEFYVGRTEFDSPEVDGEVLITSENTLKNGDFVNVKITGSEDYDLYGEVV
jgi:ribosomal protein S12 methylthiotransferase